MELLLTFVGVFVVAWLAWAYVFIVLFAAVTLGNALLQAVEWAWGALWRRRPRPEREHELVEWIAGCQLVLAAPRPRLSLPPWVRAEERSPILR